VNSAVLQAFAPYLDEIADRLAARLEQRRAREVSQKDSPLGPRRHRAAVNRRLANKEGGAGKVGRNHYLTPEAVREELARDASSASPAPAARPAQDDKPRTRKRELGDFERNLMTGLRAVKDGTG
jgi:hypothetical protein